MKARYLALFLLVIVVGFSGALSCGDNGQTNEATPEASPTQGLGTPEPAGATPKQSSATPAPTPTKERAQVVRSPSDALGCRDYVHIPRPPGPFHIGYCGLPSPDKFDTSSVDYDAHEDYASFEAIAAAAEEIGTFYIKEMPKLGWVLASSSSDAAHCDSDGYCSGHYSLEFFPEGTDLAPLQGVTIRVDLSFDQDDPDYQSLGVDVSADHPGLQKADMSMFVQGD